VYVFNCPPFFVQEICTSYFSCQTLTLQDLHKFIFELDILSIIKQKSCDMFAVLFISAGAQRNSMSCIPYKQTKDVLHNPNMGN
jgi:hypothetical protein